MILIQKVSSQVSQWFKNPKTNYGLTINVVTITGKKMEVGVQHQTSNVSKLYHFTISGPFWSKLLLVIKAPWILLDYLFGDRNKSAKGGAVAEWSKALL